MKKLLPFLLLAGGVAVFLFFRMRRGAVQTSGYSISTPFGGGSIHKDPLAGTIVVSATIAKKKGKKKGLFGGKLKAAIKKIAPGAASLAAGFIPGVGPLLSKGIDVIAKGKQA